MKIVFFGDSITEGEKSPEQPLGSGYVSLAADKLRLLYPEIEFEFVNAGKKQSGISDMLGRIKEVTEEKPDIVVLFGGIADVARKFTAEEELSEKEFAKNYGAVVSKIKETGAKLVILEPYVFKTGDKGRYRSTLEAVNAVIRKIAADRADAFVPLDEVFNGVTQDIPVAQFSTDGIHPTHRGCRYIADLLIKELKKFLG